MPQISPATVRSLKTFSVTGLGRFKPDASRFQFSRYLPLADWRW